MTPLRLFLLSLAVRAAALVPVVLASVPPVFDEAVYYARAVAMASILRTLLGGHAPLPADLHDAYWSGVWPPLQPLLLAGPMALFGSHVAVARATVVVLSALTTLVVHRLALSLVSRRAALFAALAHVFHPSFVAYSHGLWSETTYFLALLAAVLFSVRAADAPRAASSAGWASIAGACLGLSILTRAAGLLLLFALPALLWVAMRRRRAAAFASAAALAAIAVAALLPWEAVLYRATGRFVPISTAAATNFFLGNNPRVSEEVGTRVRAKAKRAITDYATAHGIDRDAAARALALEYIRAEPARFVWGITVKFLGVWAPDRLPFRYVFEAVYPPMPASLALSLWGWLVIGHLVFLFFAMRGLVAARPPPRHAVLWLGVAAISIVPALMTINRIRMPLPVMAMLFVPFGLGMANIGVGGSRARLRAATALWVACLGIAVFIPRHPAYHHQASSFYRSLTSRVGSMLGWKVSYRDVAQLRAARGAGVGPISVRVTASDYALCDRPDPALTGLSTAGGTPLTISACAESPQAPLTFEVAAERSGETVSVAPATRAAWQAWRPTGIAGLDYRWVGSAHQATEEAE